MNPVNPNVRNPEFWTDCPPEKIWKTYKQMFNKWMMEVCPPDRTNSLVIIKYDHDAPEAVAN